MEWIFEEGRIYSLGQDHELMAEATYVMQEDGEVDIDHTYVNPVLRGQGIAGKMMVVVADFIRQKGWKTVASCSYANAWLKNNYEVYADIISDKIDDNAIACRVDGKH